MRYFINMILMSLLLMLKAPPLNVNTNNSGINTKQITDKYIQLSDPTSQVYFAINKYCDIYGVPKKIAFNVANLETGWKINSKKYNPHQISYAEAFGPMQVLHTTAVDIWKEDTNIVKTITKEKLLYDIDFNVHTSIKFLRQLHNKYNDWSVVLGYYNTGYPKINSYALKGTR